MDELTSWLEQIDKELNELRAGLAESQRQIKEHRADRRKADNELLKLMRENETLKVELLGKSVADYKQSVPAFLGVMVIFTMEIIISSSIPFLGTNFDAIRRNQESFPLIWRKISVRVKLRGVVGGCVRLKSDPSILLLDDPEGLNRDEMVCPQHHLGNCEWLISLGRSKGSRTGFLAGPALSSQVGLAPRVLESPLGRPEGARAPVEVEPSSGRTEECEE
ncbi:hypothetical protein BHM03_00003530 [Ensete ventricosum]|nr:hypothetical protein BHM03_00003530 [Ensete ventricosum]